LSILIFHRVLPAPDALFPGLPDNARFGNILGWMKSWFNVLPLDHAVHRLSSGTLPERAAAITFDDGYADNVTHALPVLRAHSLFATFFIATGFLDGGCMFNDMIIEAVRACSRDTLELGSLGLGRHSLLTLQDRRTSIDRLINAIKYRPVEERSAISRNIAAAAGCRPRYNLMMSSQQVRDLSRAGMQIGAHTVSHPILTRLSADEARREIATSRNCLEEIVGDRITLFAYPNGKLGQITTEHAEMVQELGFHGILDRGGGG
jgi:peptidoglycan/xylan/chitin deacetylase (PgdA/CDA1 family)